MTDKCETCHTIRAAYALYQKSLEQREHGLVAAHRFIDVVADQFENPAAEQWAEAVNESWRWFENNLGRTPCAADVQRWIDGYVPRS